VKKLSVSFKKNILRQSKIYKNHFENSNFWGIWPLGHVGHVTYSFINIVFITAINTHGPGLSDFLKINKPQLLIENVFVKCKIMAFGQVS
jgi:hypothetical protein